MLIKILTTQSTNANDDGVDYDEDKVDDDDDNDDCGVDVARL